MKGQYLAVETVFTFGLGLMVAIGVIGLFHQYRTGTLSQVSPYQAEEVSSKVAIAMNTLKETDEDERGSGSYSVNLPEKLAGEKYNVRVDGSRVIVRSGIEVYKQEMAGFNDYNLSGGVDGGDATVFKIDNQFILRAAK